MKKVWSFLLLLTAVEVFLAYIHAPATFMLIALLALSTMKAFYIIAHFMHMRQEVRLLPLALFPITILLILSLLMLLPDAARAQCVMCKRTAEAQNAERQLVLNRGILVLLAPPLVILAAILLRARQRKPSTT
jgi:cytochrome c oxidase subunit IV